jgi:monoamine oxidase
LAVLTIALAQLRIDRLAKKCSKAPGLLLVPPRWDRSTVASWLEHSGIRRGIGRDLFDMVVRGLFAADLASVSLLDLLFLVRAHHNTTTLFSIEGGAQENLVDGGMGAIAGHVAEALGDAVHLSTPARSVAQETDRVRVRSEELEVVATWVVVAVPPALALEIHFDPRLPEDRRTLYRHAVAGSETKTLLVYDQPFWRADGLSGQSAEPGSAAEVTIDATPASGSPGVLASFTFGAVAERFDAVAAQQRRRAVLEAMARRFGPGAGVPAEFVETAWWSEPWTRGCSMAHFPPGILSRYGALLRAPFGRVHWAGTETATRSHGAVDGAVRSGERAAADIIASPA